MSQTRADVGPGKCQSGANVRPGMRQARAAGEPGMRQARADGRPGMRQTLEGHYHTEMWGLSGMHLILLEVVAAIMGQTS